MSNPTLRNLAQRGVLAQDNLLLKTIEEACELPGSFLSIWNLVGRKIEYATPTCKAVTGYEADQFLNGGPEFAFSITITDSIPSIVNAQTRYMMEAKQPDFDPCSMIIHEYPFDIRPALGYSKRLISLGVILTYTKHADLEIGVAILAEDNPAILLACRSLLISIKERHNQIYKHPPFAIRHQTLHPVTANEQAHQKLTPREEEILKLLANGLTSSQIAKRLGIEENTVETHRKNILLKFEAKNIAELIKKASKVYWLE